LDHPSIGQFIDNLQQKFNDYFKLSPTLDLEVTETAFFLEGNKIYEETQLNRSLPFLFYKDGITRLSFHEGLTREEIIQFFQLLLEISTLPPEETDIVVFLWEMDFSHIDYFAPDDFLETKIGQETEIAPYEINPADFTQGVIQLTPEDQATLLHYGRQAKINQDRDPSLSPLLEDKLLLPSLRKLELQREEEERLEFILQKHRELSEEEETIHLLVETIFMEEKIQPFTQVLHSLSLLIEDTLRQGKLAVAAHALDHLLQLKSEFQKTQPEKVLHIEKTLDSLQEKFPPLLREQMDQKKPLDMESLFLLFEFIGPSSLNLLGYLADTYPDQNIHDLAHSYIQKIGAQNISLLLTIADDRREKITLTIMQTIAQTDDAHRLTYLARFLRSHNPHLQKEAIKLISAIKDPKAAKLLLPLLNDPQAEIRKEVARAICRLNQPSVAEEILGKVKDKSFFERTPTEKKALLSYLFHLPEDKASEFLKSFLKKPWWWSPASRLKPALWLIETLKDEKTEEVKIFLDKVGFVRNKRIRHALQGLRIKLESSSSPDYHSPGQSQKENKKSIFKRK